MKRSLETSEKSTKKPKISLEPDVSELGDSDSEMQSSLEIDVREMRASDLEGMPSGMQSSLELDVRETKASDLEGMPPKMQSSLIKLASAQKSYVALSNRNSLNSELRSAEQELEKAYLAIRDLFFDTDNYSLTSVAKLLQLGFDPNIENSRGATTLLQVLSNILVLPFQFDDKRYPYHPGFIEQEELDIKMKIIEESEKISKLLFKYSSIEASDIYNFYYESCLEVDISKNGRETICCPMEMCLIRLGEKAFKICMNLNISPQISSIFYTSEQIEISANYGEEYEGFTVEEEDIIDSVLSGSEMITMEEGAQTVINKVISITKHFGCFVSSFWKAEMNDDKKITDYRREHHFIGLFKHYYYKGFPSYDPTENTVEKNDKLLKKLFGDMSDLCSTLDIAYKSEMGITLFPSEIKFKKSEHYVEEAAKEQATLAQEQLAAIRSFIPAVVSSKLKQNDKIIEAEKSATKCLDCDDMLKYIIKFLPRNELNKITYARKEVQESKNLLKNKISSIESKGYSVQDVSGDGNCFFHAVALALQDSNYNAAGLRAMAIDYILNHPEQFQGFVEHNLDAYVDDMVGDGTWADNQVIQALSLALNRPITIFHINGREININDSIENSDIHLLYTGNHYMSITPTTHNPSEEVTIERSSHTVDDFTTVLMQSSSTTSEEATQDIESMHSKLAKSNQLEFSVDQGISSIIENMFGSGQNSLDDLIGTKESYALEASNRGFFDSFGNVVDYLSNKLSSLLDIEVEGSAVEATVLQLQALLTMAGSGNMPMGIPNRYNPDDDDGDFEPYFGGGNGGIVSFDNTPELPQNIQIVTILGNGTLVVAEDSHNTQ